MFNLFKKNEQQGTVTTLKIDGMHCTSCAINIDDTVEELPGVFKSDTSYAKSKTIVTFDESKVSTEEIIKAIEGLDYTVSD